VFCGIGQYIPLHESPNAGAAGTAGVLAASAVTVFGGPLNPDSGGGIADLIPFYVAVMSRGAAGSNWEPLKQRENSCNIRDMEARFVLT
jgi:hypothetical protein